MSETSLSIFKSEIVFNNITYEGNVTPEGYALHMLLTSSKVTFIDSTFSNK